MKVFWFGMNNSAFDNRTVSLDDYWFNNRLGWFCWKRIWIPRGCEHWGSSAQVQGGCLEWISSRQGEAVSDSFPKPGEVTGH